MSAMWSRAARPCWIAVANPYTVRTHNSSSSRGPAPLALSMTLTNNPGSRTSSSSGVISTMSRRACSASAWKSQGITSGTTPGSVPQLRSSEIALALRQNDSCARRLSMTASTTWWTTSRSVARLPAVDRESRRLVFPDVLLETVRGEAAGAAELRAERFVEPDGIEGPNQWSHELGDEDAVTRMPAIARRQELHIAPRDGSDQLSHALRRRRRPSRIDHEDRFRLRELSGGEDRAQRGVLAGEAVI